MPGSNTRAFIGDIHGLIDELQELYAKLCWMNVDEIWHVGDLVDRGKDSGAVVEFCRTKGIRGVLGNHENSILQYRKTFSDVVPKNPDKRRTCNSIRSEADWDYMAVLPPLHVFDDRGLILVHGGLVPKLPLYAQPKATVIRAQLLHPDYPNKTRWFDVDREGVSEEVHLANGWRRWYDVYDGEHDVIYGHSSFHQPHIQRNPGCGQTIGIDTGSCFGGALTACVYSSDQSFFFVSVKARELYFPISNRMFWRK